MAGLVTFADPAEFTGAWTELDWSKAPAAKPKKLNSGKFIDARPELYAAHGGTVEINKNGPPARLGYSDQNDREYDYAVNLRRGGGMVVSRKPDTSTEAFNTPIFLRFQNPVSALGTYVTVWGENVLDGSALHAVLWVYPAGSQTWTPVSGDGLAGTTPLPPKAPMTAPFVGCDASADGGIKMVCFDVSLTGSFRRLMISSLLWA